MMAVQTITLWQPWATLIAEGWKVIETRTHDRFRCLEGQEIAIHAGKKWHSEGVRMIYNLVEYIGPNMDGYSEILDIISDKDGLPSGAIVCTARVQVAEWMDDYSGSTAEDDVRALCGTSGLFGLYLKDIKKLESPVPATGSMGIWLWDRNQEIIKNRKDG